MMKERINHYLNQDVVWAKKIDTDAFGKGIFEEQIIWTRREGRERMITDVSGSVHVSQSTFFCTQPVRVGDVLNGCEVLGVSEMVNRRGKIVGYEVLT